MASAFPTGYADLVEKNLSSDALFRSLIAINAFHNFYNAQEASDRNAPLACAYGSLGACSVATLLLYPRNSTWGAYKEYSSSAAKTLAIQIIASLSILDVAIIKPYTTPWVSGKASLILPFEWLVRIGCCSKQALFTLLSYR